MGLIAHSWALATFFMVYSVAAMVHPRDDENSLLMTGHRLESRESNTDGLLQNAQFSKEHTIRRRSDTVQYKICVKTGNGWDSGTGDRVYAKFGTRRKEWPDFVLFPAKYFGRYEEICGTSNFMNLEDDANYVVVKKTGIDEWYPLYFSIKTVGERGLIYCYWSKECGGTHEGCRFPDNAQEQIITCDPWTIQ